MGDDAQPLFGQHQVGGGAGGVGSARNGDSDISLLEGGMQGWESAGLLTAVEFESNGAARS